MAQNSKREHIVETAINLFCQSGFHATGVDRIMREAGVSKKTLYNHFESKDALILACLEKYDVLFRTSFVTQVESKADDPKGRLLAIFDVAEDWFTSQNFFGCMFINVIGEYSAPDSPFRSISKDFKNLMKSYILNLTTEAKASDPQKLADEWAILLEGAIVTAQVMEQASAAQTAKFTATLLLEHYCKG